VSLYTPNRSNQEYSSRTAPTVLLAGPWQHVEFAAVRAEMDTANQWPTFPSLAAAIEQLPSESSPDLILLAQPRPAVDRQEHVERLRRIAPLARIILVAGTWCEGELRTGQPLTGVIRLYWYELPPWWRACCRQWARRESSPWAEPLTEIRPGQFLRVDGAGPPHDHGDKLLPLAIDATDYAVFEALKTGLASYGWTTIWQPRHRPQLNRELAEPPAAAIWDGSQLDPIELESLAQLGTRMAVDQAPVVALLDFPRVEHLSIAKAAGAAALLGKPYQLALLHDELTRVTTHRPAPSE
jgi:CheY-like chemotaxis protein